MSKNTTQIKAAVVREKGGPFNHSGDSHNFSERPGFLTSQQFLAAVNTADSSDLRWHNACINSRRRRFDQCERTMKIEKDSQGGKTTIRLSGQFQSEHVEELNKQLQENGPRFVLDLKEVTVVDVEVVRFLATCKANGVKIIHCPRYIRQWMARERKP
jgi:hypothetical protein